jgi:acetolactate synthase-1/2/3 large subunit
LLEILHARGQDSELKSAIRAGQAAVREGWLADEKGGQGVAPPRLLKTLQEVFGSDTVFTTDSGNGTFLAMECFRLETPRSYLAPIDYSCMGYSVPAALGAALACPDRPVVALAGDGAFLMTGLELLTASQLQLPVAVLVLRDKRLAQISQFQENAFARTTASELPAFDLAAFSRGMNVEYLSISQNDEITEVLREARALMEEKTPVLVEVAIDYSAKTYFTKGVVRVTLNRLPRSDRLRFLARAIGRRLPISGL